MFILKYIKNLFHKPIFINEDIVITKKDDFIKGHWYKFSTHNIGLTFYFIFGKRENDNIYIDNDYYLVVFSDGEYGLRYTQLRSIITSCVDSYHYEEVDYKEIVQMMPDDEPIKIAYMRKKKIKNLLNGI